LIDTTDGGVIKGLTTERLMRFIGTLPTEKEAM
jgi:hypothetical protein